MIITFKSYRFNIILYIPIFIAIGIYIKNIYILVLLSILLLNIQTSILFIACILGYIISIDNSVVKNKQYHRVIGTIEEISEHMNKKIMTITDKTDKYKIISLIKQKEEINIGDKISTVIKNTIYKPCHRYDFNNYLKLNKIKYNGFAIKKIKIIKKGKINLIQKIRSKIEETFKNKYINYPIAIALTTGNRKYISQSMRDNFARNGLSHLLAISGLHISIVIYSTYLFLNKIIAMIPYLILRYHFIYKINLVISWFIGLFYVFISGLGIPAIRTIIMSALLILASIYNRRAISLRIVAISASIILCFYPYALYSASFQMSFAAVTCLIYFRQRSLLLSTFIASIATMPLSIYHFYQCSTYSAILNIIAIPLTTFFIMPMLMFNIFCIIFHLPSVYIQLPLNIMEYISSISLPYSILKYHITSISLVIIVFIFLFYIIEEKLRYYICPALIVLLCIIPKKQVKMIISQNNIGLVKDNKLYIYGRGRTIPRKWSQRLNLPIVKCKKDTFNDNQIQVYNDKAKINDKLIENFNYIEIYHDDSYIIG